MSENNSRNEMFRKICALIPNQVTNRTVVNTLELMRKQQNMMRRDYSGQLEENQVAFRSHVETIRKMNGYIEDQNAYEDMKFGKATMKYSGCEIMAAFNALNCLRGGPVRNLPRIISIFEKDGMIMNGLFGTAPKALADYFNGLGFETAMSTYEEAFDALGRKSDALILTMYNDKDDISKEVHTVCISKENQQFTAHNVYGNGQLVGPYPDITQLIGAIHGGKAKGISLIGIRKETK